MGEVRAGSAIASAASSKGAGAAGEAVGEAVAGLSGAAQLVLAFPSGIAGDRAASDAHAAAGGAPTVGLTGAGSIAADGAIEVGCSALAFGAGVSIGLGLSRFAGRAPRQAARHAAAEALSTVGISPEVTLLLLLDTACGDPADAVAGAVDAAGPRVPLVGGGAGGEDPAQILGGNAYRDAVIAVAIRTARPAGVGYAHGCVPLESPATVTLSRGVHICELDDRPAADVYTERLDCAGMELSDGEFEALAITHPIAQQVPGGCRRPRHVIARGPQGSLACTSHVPQGATIDFMQQEPADVVSSAGRAVEGALAELEGPPGATLVFDCAARKRAVADSLALEVEEMRCAFAGSPPPMAGLYSFGEIYQRGGPSGGRNHSIVVVAFP